MFDMNRITSYLLAASLLISTANAATPFDGQYINPNESNSQVEWWWGSAVGSPSPQSFGVPGPQIQFIFYQGYPILETEPKNPSLPEYYISINGYYPNGTDFALTIPSETGFITPGDASVQMTGTWGTVGSFAISQDLRTFTVNFNASAAPYGITGTLKFSSNRANHFGCNTTSTPYFSDFAPSGGLNDNEKVLYNELGWAVAVPGGTVDVDITINGTQLQFTGDGYHDQNWMPLPLNDFIDTWYFGFGQVGPYTFSYVSVLPKNSSTVFTTGYLATDETVLQNQCGVNGTRTSDISIIRPHGRMGGADGTVAPAGWTIGYVLGDGSEYEFELTPVAANPSSAVYQRWTGPVKGGLKGGLSYENVATFEWLNPGLTTYTP